MRELQVGDQTIRFDREVTLACYRKVELGFPESCGCRACGNFALQRDTAYPAWFLGLLEQLGVDPAKEADAHECGLIESGQLMYGGWFVFVGELLVAGESVEVRPEAPDFTMFFNRSFPSAPPGFEGEPLLAAEFTTHLDWVLAEPHE